jgi:hypothetical protein
LCSANGATEQRAGAGLRIPTRENCVRLMYEGYLKHGSISFGNKNAVCNSQCVICDIFANESLKPSSLKRHLLKNL